MAQQFDDTNFEKEVLKSDLPVLVDFSAEWCGPCKMLAPVIEKLAIEFAGKVKIGKVDVDASNQTASKYMIQSIPTLLIFKKGEVIAHSMGFQSEENLRRQLNSII
jgi:thioredoxin 1